MSGDGKKGMNAFDDVTSDDETNNEEEEPVEEDNSEVVSKSVERTSPDTDRENSGTNSVESTTEKKEETNSTASPGLDTPSFTHKDVERQSVYIFTETWEQVLDMRFEARNKIRQKQGLRNIDKRELDEAMLTLAMQEIDIEDVVDLIIENRKNPPQQNTK